MLPGALHRSAGDHCVAVYCTTSANSTVSAVSAYSTINSDSVITMNSDSYTIIIIIYNNITTTKNKQGPLEGSGPVKRGDVIEPWPDQIATRSFRVLPLVTSS